MTQATLYERLGGVYAIAAVVDDFVDRIMADPILEANPHIAEAHKRITGAGFKYLVTEFVCEVAGGPQKYTGRSMYDSHVHLKMTNAEWDAFVHDFQQSLFKFEVPAQERSELLAAVGPLKAEMGLID
ncbi:MAG: group 1 truncated hemoglobin [Chloroflexota bacterium]